MDTASRRQHFYGSLALPYPSVDPARAVWDVTLIYGTGEIYPSVFPGISPLLFTPFNRSQAATDLPADPRGPCVSDVGQAHQIHRRGPTEAVWPGVHMRIQVSTLGGWWSLANRACRHHYF